MGSAKPACHAKLLTHHAHPPHHFQGTIIVVKIMAMQTTWIGGKSVAKTTGKLIKGPRTSSGTPNHQLSKRKRKTKKRTAATRWSSLLALHFGTYPPVATAFWRRHCKIRTSVLITKIFFWNGWSGCNFYKNPATSTHREFFYKWAQNGVKWNPCKWPGINR